MTSIQLAETDQDLVRCFPVMVQLRPHLSVEGFVAQVKRQQVTDRFRIAYVKDDEAVRAVAGFRVGECLAWGRFMYVDDLVTDSAGRSRGYGGRLLDWLVARARDSNCDQFHLDSGVQRFDAHRFYLMKRMAIAAHHFAMTLKVDTK